MSLFVSSITGRILDDGSTPAETIELQGVTAGQVATILTQYTPLDTTAANTVSIGANAAALAALQTQVAALCAPPDLTPYALAVDLAAAEGSIAANQSSLTALSASLTTGLANKANQSALDALQLEVATKSTPASVDTKLQAFSNTAAMNSAIASANNATLASVASNYALRTVTDQLALDLAAKQSGPDVDQKIATALLDRPSTTDLTAAVNLKTAPADVDLKVATALLPYTDTTGVNSLLAVRDAHRGFAGCWLSDGAPSRIGDCHGTAAAPHASDLGRRPRAAGRPPRRSRLRDLGPAVCRALRELQRPHGCRDFAAERHRCHPRAISRPDNRRRNQFDQRAGLAWGNYLGLAGWDKPNPQFARHSTAERQRAE